MTASFRPRLAIKDIAWIFGSAEGSCKGWVKNRKEYAFLHGNCHPGRAHFALTFNDGSNACMKISLVKQLAGKRGSQINII